MSSVIIMFQARANLLATALREADTAILAVALTKVSDLTIA